MLDPTTTSDLVTHAAGPLLSADNGIALLTLTSLEVVLGIDNIVFIAILTAKLPPEQRKKARRVGLALALIGRVGLLLTLNWMMRLQSDLFSILGQGISGKDLILIVGGLFLIGKATTEIHGKVEGSHADHGVGAGKPASFRSVIAQILVIDIVFSLDSVITAVGMAQDKRIMITAVVIAVGIMMAFANRISDFIEKHPTLKMLALSFLLLIGVVLVADGLGRHIEKGYIYFAMAFSLAVEFLNMRMRRKSTKKRFEALPH
jgi:predicted tellurium resistance membrane protein TerC